MQEWPTEEGSIGTFPEGEKQLVTFKGVKMGTGRRTECSSQRKNICKIPELRKGMPGPRHRQ